jgi:hypothetical protein
MLSRETVDVYCENHTEHTDTVRTSQETNHVSSTEPNWLMLNEYNNPLFVANEGLLYSFILHAQQDALTHNKNG